MLDLDNLAQKRAEFLQQKEDAWRAAIWSPEFQKLSTNMSDGEVESLVSLCPSVDHLKKVVKFLDERSSANGVAPYSVLTEEAAKAGVGPGDWVLSQWGSTP